MPSRLLLYVALALACPSFAGAASAAPRDDLVDSFAYADDAAARQAWQPMQKEIAPVSVAEIDGRKVLRMPCNFKGTKIERGSWDRSVRLDLAAWDGLRFKVLCRDPSPIAHFNLYLQSGDGWYAATFAPTSRTDWSTIEIRKEDMGTEGKPAGWGAVRTIRISAWRGSDQDTEFCLSDLRLLGEDAPIAIVRAESAMGAGEGQGVRQYAAAVSLHLKSLGLPCSTLSDLDLAPDRLKGKKLVILPFNPSMPDAVADAIARFVEGGGKVIVCYSLPGQLAPLAAIQWKSHVSQKYPGQFASIRFQGAALAGAPASVAQASWNIHEVRAIEGRSRVAAEWFDKDGQDTGYPAVIVSDSCIYVSHVLLADDPAGKRRMLLAMAGHLVPELWKEAAARSLERIGRFGAFQSRKEADQAIRRILDDMKQAKGIDGGRAEAATKALASVTGLTSQAQAHLDKGDYADCIGCCERATETYLKVWCTLQPSPPGEHRAFWCHSPFGVAGMEWDEAAKLLADNGFTAILPNMCWGGSACYESTVLPVAPEVKEKGDQVAKCLAACRKYGLKCHVWKVNWNTFGRAPKEFTERMRQAGRLQVDFGGNPRNDWLCPSHPENQKLEIDAMVELATKYDVDGVHFDYIRYPDESGCFCPGCRERFEKVLGRAVAQWPADVRKDDQVRTPWLDFRRDQITRVVAAVSETVRRTRPQVKISAAVFPNWPIDRDQIGQDWKLWCEKGYLDFVCPMDYTSSPAAFEGLVARQVGWAGKVPVYPGIGLSVWTPECDVVKLIEMVTIARRLGARGFTVFEYSASTAREVVPMCGLGITRPKP